MARPKNTDQRRQQIVDGLLHVMAEVGYQKASIKQIAKAAQLAPGLVHYHFSSKAEVLLELMNRLEGGLWRRYEEAVGDRTDSPEAQLRAFVFAHVGKGKGEDPDRVRAWLAVQAEALHVPELGDLARAATRKRLEVLEDILRKVLRGRGRRRKGAGRLAAAVLGALDGSLWLGTLAPKAMPPGSAMDSITAMVDGLLAAEPPRRSLK